MNRKLQFHPRRSLTNYEFKLLNNYASSLVENKQRTCTRIYKQLIFLILINFINDFMTIKLFNLYKTEKIYAKILKWEHHHICFSIYS